MRNDVCLPVDVYLEKIVKIEDGKDEYNEKRVYVDELFENIPDSEAKFDLMRFIDKELRERYEYALNPELDEFFCVLENEGDCIKYYRSLNHEDWDWIKNRLIDVLNEYKGKEVYGVMLRYSDEEELTTIRETNKEPEELIGIALCSDGEYYYVKDKFGKCHFYEDLKEIEHK